MVPESATERLAQQLFAACASGAAPVDVPANWIPVSFEAAFDVQERLLELRGGRPGGWKVGSGSADGPIQGAPLPADGCHASPATLRRADFSLIGLELEIAFRFGRSFAPSPRDYGTEEIMDAVVSFGATIELVASRLKGWPNVDKRLQLADLQNHGALVFGEQVPYTRDFPFLAPELRFGFNGNDIAPHRPANPAGDPRRMLAWAVNHCTTRGRWFDAGIIVTTGTYTGCHFALEPGTAEGKIDGLPAVRLSIA
jgi:2-keto-4-pentenoate hydratase